MSHKFEANHNKEYSVVKTFRLLPIVLYRWAFLFLKNTAFRNANRKICHDNKQKKEPISRFLLGCGGLTRTSDLWVMSPTSYHCSTPRSRVNHISCDYGCKGRGFVFNVQAFHCKKSIIELLLNFIHKAGAVL